MSLPRALQPSVPAPDLDILGDRVTLHPGGYLAPSQQHDPAPERNLVENMARFRQNPLDFFREVSLHVSGHGWRAHDNVIGQATFYAGFSEKMKSDIMQTQMLRCRIEQLARRRVEVEKASGLRPSAESSWDGRLQEVEDSLREVALAMIDAMICKMESKAFIRGAYYLCTQLLTRAYHQGIHVSSEEVLRLRSVAEEAAKQKRSIVFLPCHRSHVDYVSLQLICYRLGIALPTVVAGDNLNLPLVGSFLQHAGAMWIKRSFGDNPLYSTLVQSYIDTLLQRGFNFECFIEGGRSRTGKLLSPKFGILSFLLDSVLSGRVEDAIICPVSTQYDKVIETESYINELLGQPKPRETLKDFVSASSVLSLRLGRVDVRFSEPWSLKDFIAKQRARAPEDNMGSVGASNRSNERSRMLRTLGFKVLSDINTVSVVMPTALVGTVLLTLRGRGVGESELIRRVEWLGNRVRQKGGRVAHFAGTPTKDVISRALEVLGSGLIGSIPGLPEQTYYAVDRFQLSFYRNMTIHLFIAESLVSAAMYMKVKEGGAPDDQSITFDEMYQQVSFLSSIFRGEFIYSTSGLLQNLREALSGLERDRVITLQRTTSGDIGAAWLSREERETGRENFDFYCFLIWPFVESAWLASIFLMGLAPRRHEHGEAEEILLNYREVQDATQLLGKTLYHQGDLSYFESVNKENLKNAFQLFEEEGIVIVHRPGRDEKLPASIRLAGEWASERTCTGQISPSGRLWTFVELIAKSRREGKNRRDGATVRSRVLALVDQLGSELFINAQVNPTGGAGLGDTGELRRRRRSDRASALKARL